MTPTPSTRSLGPQWDVMTLRVARRIPEVGVPLGSSRRRRRLRRVGRLATDL